MHPTSELALAVPFRRRAVTLLLLCAVAVLCVAALPASAARAATGSGWIRMAHLSPDTPKVDVYLTSFSGPKYSLVLRGVGYGVVSPYQRVTPGIYTVSMRSPGAPATGTALLSTNVTVAAAHSYTVAGVGPHSSLSLRVILDDLTPPAAGTARARVVQASSLASVVDVVTTSGAVIAKGARFATTTNYAEVPAGVWQLRVIPKVGSAAASVQTVDARSGGIYTLLVLDEGKTVTLVSRADAAGVATMPQGGVNTGLGGAATGSSTPSSPGATAGLLAVVGLALLLAGLVTGRRAWAR